MYKHWIPDGVYLDQVFGACLGVCSFDSSVDLAEQSWVFGAIEGKQGNVLLDDANQQL